MKFKLGDRVIINEKTVHTIVSVDTGNTDFEYAIDDYSVYESCSDKFNDIKEFREDWGDAHYLTISIIGGNHYKDVAWLFNENEIRLFQLRNTKLSRKMYPNHKVIDKDWIIPYEA